MRRYARRLAKQPPSIAKTRVSPHTIRHSAATRLLQSGVDINIIRDWLGHVSVDTTNRYARIDMKTKARPLLHVSFRWGEAKCTGEKIQNSWLSCTPYDRCTGLIMWRFSYKPPQKIGSFSGKRHIFLSTT